MRKGTIVKYIGKDEIAKGMTFRVIRRRGNLIEVHFPIRYCDGSIHASASNQPITDFEIVR